MGGSGPVLVLLHGWPQTSRAWARVLPALARTHTVVAPDLRGTGAGDRPVDGYAKTNQADGIRGVLKALGLRGPVAVAGHDVGSMVALAWAAAHPEEVSHLVLIDALLPGLGLEEATNVAEGGMWHFGFFMTEHVPGMLFDGHELEFFSATFTAMSNPGTFTDEDLAAYARAYSGRHGADPLSEAWATRSVRPLAAVSSAAAATAAPTTRPRPELRHRGRLSADLDAGRPGRLRPCGMWCGSGRVVRPVHGGRRG
ncbi:alpha/beta fold hydrolase [Streptomyces sp. NPDC059258]|uniref:alpha/beta fold hydrolase n=1 Tax=unclassified Streptomyces TaxID=2593676 RepID=UPI0036B4732C